METMQIRQAKIEDFPQILALYDRARAFMAEHGNPTQWGKNYPPEELVKGDIQNGNQYVGMADGKIVATGDGSLVDKINQEGYESFIREAGVADARN